MKIFKRITAHLLLILILVIGVNPSSALAAGSATVTVERSTSSVNTGKTAELRFYVTTSGAQISGVEFKVSLTKLTFSSYSYTGSPFGAINGVVQGNSAGSTVFTIAAASFSPQSPGKHYIGKAVVKAGNSTGTATVGISEVAAADSNDEPMAATGQGTTLSVTAPPAPAPSPTPEPEPDPINTKKANTSNPTTSPNPDNEVAVPDSNSQNPGTKTVSDQELADAFNQSEEDLANNAKQDEAAKKRKDTLFALVGSLLLLGLLILGGTWLKRHRAKVRDMKHHGFGSAAITSENFQATNRPVAEPPKETPGNNDGPTVITPQR